MRGFHVVIAGLEDHEPPRRMRGVVRPGLGAAAQAPEVIPSRRVQCGDILFETIHTDRRKTMQLRSTANTVVMLFAISGRVSVTAEEFAESASPHVALLLARPGAAKAVWEAGAQGLVAHLPRRRIQAAASQDFGAPHRLASINLLLGREDATERLFNCVGSVFSPVLVRKDACFENTKSLIMALIEALGVPSSVGGRTPFIQAGSVRRTLDYIREPSTTDYSLQRLAAAAGVTERTLRDNFRNVLGQSLPTVIQRCRLEAAHARLASALDSRPVQAFALDAGFKSAGAFARAYQRLFGESPTATRVLAAKNFDRQENRDDA
jgi:AraC-like DNA-binding protein